MLNKRPMYEAGIKIEGVKRQDPKPVIDGYIEVLKIAATMRESLGHHAINAFTKMVTVPTVVVQNCNISNS